TYWTQSQGRVSKALERIRRLVPLPTRGRSRMRESRTYGSGRGACDETHVPTATAPGVHHAAWRRGGGMAARGGGAAGGKAADHWVPGHDHAFSLEPMGRRFCATIARLRLD